MRVIVLHNAPSRPAVTAEHGIFARHVANGLNVACDSTADICCRWTSVNVVEASMQTRPGTSSSSDMSSVPDSCTVLRRTGPALDVDVTFVQYETYTLEGVADLPRSAKGAGYDCAVLSGSKFDVSYGLPWMKSVEAWLRRQVAEGLPILGICFGHQQLASALGGAVAPMPRGIVEKGMARYALRDDTKDPLTRGLPSEFDACGWHGETVALLPDGAISLAESPSGAGPEKNAIIKFAPLVYGVQFHPEFHPALVKSIAKHIANEAVTNLAPLKDVPHAMAIIPRFLDLVARSQLAASDNNKSRGRGAKL